MGDWAASQLTLLPQRLALGMTQSRRAVAAAPQRRRKLGQRAGTRRDGGACPGTTGVLGRLPTAAPSPSFAGFRMAPGAALLALARTPKPSPTWIQ